MAVQLKEGYAHPSILPKLAHFDLVSDIHLDEWVSPYLPVSEQIYQIEALVSTMVPSQPNQVLLIAGDLGHCNEQSFILLKALREYYDHILFVFGNHDYYLNPNKSLYQSSEQRICRLVRKVDSFFGDSVWNLDKGGVTVEGVRYIGASVWYDYSFSGRSRYFGFSDVQCHWRSTTKDGRFISTLPSSFKRQRFLAEQMDEGFDVVVTHVPPTEAIMDTYAEAKGSLIDVISFSGDRLLEKARGKVWCYGHVHVLANNRINDTLYLNNSFGGGELYATDFVYDKSILSKPKKVGNDTKIKNFGILTQ